MWVFLYKRTCIDAHTCCGISQSNRQKISILILSISALTGFPEVLKCLKDIDPFIEII